MIAILIAVIGGFLVWWGIDILRTGYRLPAVLRPPSTDRLAPLPRLGEGTVRLVTGLAILGILGRLQVSAFGQSGAWLAGRGRALVFSLLLIAIGTLAVSRPEGVLRDCLRDQPDAPHDRIYVITARLIGAAFIVGGLVILVFG